VVVRHLDPDRTGRRISTWEPAALDSMARRPPSEATRSSRLRGALGRCPSAS
jgi:hypothetical protein